MAWAVVFPHDGTGRLADSVGAVSFAMAAVRQEQWRCPLVAGLSVSGCLVAYFAVACGLRLIAAGDIGAS